jgi:stage V sporulation protein SpoVS
MLELEVKRGYVTATEAARIEGISRQAINQRLKAGRIKGAFLMDCGDGREIWVVPRKQLKPKEQKCY